MSSHGRQVPPDRQRHHTQPGGSGPDVCWLFRLGRVPKLDCLVRATRCQDFTICAEGKAPNCTCMSFDRRKFLAIGYRPKLDRPVLVAGSECLAIRAEDHELYLGGVPLDDFALLTRNNVPQLDVVIFAARRSQDFAVPANSRSRNLKFTRGSSRVRPFAGDDVPNLDYIPGTRRNERFAIRVKSDRREITFSVECGDRSLGGYIEQPYETVTSDSGHEGLAIWAEHDPRRGALPFIVSQKRALLRGHIPEFDLVVRAPYGELLAVGTERHGAPQIGDRFLDVFGVFRLEA